MSLFVSVIFLCLSLFSQQIIEESIVINVEVPVRVFKAGTFVDNLTIDDFEVFEEGILQKIEAVYLVKKRTIERSEEMRRFSPETSRDFYLFFETSDYTAKLGDAIEHFIHNVISPGDYLMVVTPMKTYKLNDRALRLLPREDIVNRIKGMLRKDILIGYSEYRRAISDLEKLALSLTTTLAGRKKVLGQVDEFGTDEYNEMPVDEQLMRYDLLLSKLENLRHVDQKKLLDFAEILKGKEGQKNIFMFYQREYIPQVESRILNQYMSMYQDRPDIQQTLSGLFEFHRRYIPFNVDKIKKAYADSSISIHFLYITKPPQRSFGLTMQEQSEDIFSAFREMAHATGGFVDTSANPDFLFQKAVEASENYYLLYYSPLNYKKDGKFKEIKVKVKDKNYRVFNRAGYFAN